LERGAPVVRQIRARGGLNGSPSHPGRVTLYVEEGETSTMKRSLSATQKMTRHAFGLLLELRDHRNAFQLLSQAITFLELLVREKEVDATPIMLSVRVAQLRKS